MLSFANQHFRWRNPSLRIWGIVALLALVAVGLQAGIHHVIISVDTMFHFSRFYDTAMQIKTGHFNYFQLNYGFYHSGRIINAVYGPLFAYCAGALLLLVHSYLAFELVSSWLCYFVAGCGMWYLCRSVRAKHWMSFLLTVIYLNCGWVPRWQIATNTTAWGAALAPWLFLLGVRMVTQQHRPIVWWQLALVTSLLVQTHVLSSLILIITLIPFAVIGLVTTPARKAMLLEGSGAVIVTLILTASFWAPYWELTHTNTIANPNPRSLVSGVLTIAHNSTFDQAAVLLGVLALIGIQCGLALMVPTKLNTWCTLLAALLFACTTKAFPWSTLQAHFPALLHTFQFPARLYVAAYPLILLGVAISSTQLTFRQAQRITLVVALVAAQAWLINAYTIVKATRMQISTSQYGQKYGATKQQVIAAVASSDLAAPYRISVREAPDYLAVYHGISPDKSTKITQTETNSVILPSIHGKFQHSVTSNGTLKLTWTSHSTKTITVPVNTYHNSVVTVNGRRIRLTAKNVNLVGAVKVKQRRGTNTLTLNYHASWFTRSAITCSIIAWIGLLLGGLPAIWWRNRH